jgi:hypothetical protein
MRKHKHKWGIREYGIHTYINKKIRERVWNIDIDGVGCWQLALHFASSLKYINSRDRD